MDTLLLRVPEAAALLSVSRSRCYELIYQGVIPAMRVGATWRVPRLALERWIAAQTEAAGASWQGQPAAEAKGSEVASFEGFGKGSHRGR